MPPDLDVDVVVVGFGTAGAAAALAAAEEGARVAVLDRTVRSRRRFAAARLVRSAPAGVRAAALAAGVELRPGCQVHELAVTAGEISGVGYSTLPATGTAARAHRWLRASERLAPAVVTPPLLRAADAVWRSAFLVGEVACSSVVLALAPRHWEFVGPAVWTAARTAGRTGTAVPTPRSRRLRTVPSMATAALPAAELPVRRWCAGQDASSTGQEDLEVDEESGAVLIGERLVPGLYSAVSLTDPGTVRFERAFAAGRRAGQGAAVAAGRHVGDVSLSLV
ncbi:FAD-binding protein [Streptomyces sp. NPDC090075]|uniref:FAD-binding protein n=1 Tax=Streptomyces sp. NPDC090075 TaxID=3365937 RepID=UPI00381D5CBB